MRQKALALGLIKTTKEALTPQQKVLAAQAAIMEQTSDAQGDFARTSGGLANQQRIMSATFADASAKLGEKLLPVITQIVSWINEKLFPAIEWLGVKISEFFAFIEPVLTPIWNLFKGIVDVVTGLVTLDFGKVWAGLGGIVTGAWDAIRALGGMLLDLGKFVLGKIWDGIKFAATEFWAWFSAVPGWIGDKIKALPGALVDLGKWIIGKIVTGLGDLAAGAWDFLKWISSKVWDGLTGLVTLGAQAVGWVVVGLGQGVWDILKWLGDIIAKAWNGIVNLGKKIGQGIVEGLKGAISGMGDSFSELGKGNITGSIYGGYGFATGGWVDPKPGGHFVNVGEGGQREWIIPDPLMNKVIANAGAYGGGGGRGDMHVVINGVPDAEGVKRAMQDLLFELRTA